MDPDNLNKETSGVPDAEPVPDLEPGQRSRGQSGEESLRLGERARRGDDVFTVKSTLLISARTEGMVGISWHLASGSRRRDAVG